jgi:hypothetical protein
MKDQRSTFPRCVVFLLSFLFIAGSAFGAGSPYQGEWREVDFEGFSQWDNGECVAAYLLERVLTIFPLQENASTLNGNHINLLHGRLVQAKKPGCRLPETSDAAPFIYENMRTWHLILRPEAGKGSMRLDAIYDDSKGDRCTNCFTGTFKSTLSMENGAIRDSYDTEQPGDDLIFRTEADRAARIASGQETVRRFISLMEAKDYSKAYQMFDRRFQANMAEAHFVTESKRIFGAAGAISRSVQEKYYVSRVKNGNSYISGNFVFFTNRLVTSQGGALEFLLLEKTSGGEWKIISYFVQG